MQFGSLCPNSAAIFYSLGICPFIMETITLSIDPEIRLAIMKMHKSPSDFVLGWISSKESLFGAKMN